MRTSGRRVVVVGGGITGLAAAHRLAERAPGVEVLLLEQSPRLGGKLHTATFADRPVERGAEAFLAASPRGGPSAAVELARAVGLGADLVHPRIGKAAVVLDGVLRDLPAGTLMGIPAVTGPQDADDGRPLLPPGGDIAVGALVRPRCGDATVDDVVDPLLGGVYAGRADELSLRMALPALAAAAEHAHTLGEAVRVALRERRTEPGQPVFATVAGGVSRLVDVIAAKLPQVRLRSTVRRLEPVGRRFRLTVGPTADESTVDADGVVLAVPATPAARLLSTMDGVRPVGLEYANVALVSLAYQDPDLPEISGFLVPATGDRHTKAVTFFDRKWAHHRAADGISVVRASVGRFRDDRVLLHRDEDLAQLVHRELGALLRTDLAPPRDTMVARWGGALPQYTAGHAERVRALRATLSAYPALAVAGAAYDGVGIPACIESGRVAADAVLAGMPE